MEGEPPHWSNNLRVEDVDASVQGCVANGGTLLVLGTDIPRGRFAGVTSPSGAMVSLFHEADLDTATNHPGGSGSVRWTELHSTDLDADLAWLEAVFGFNIGNMPMPGGMELHLQARPLHQHGAAVLLQAEDVWGGGVHPRAPGHLRVGPASSCPGGGPPAGPRGAGGHPADGASTPVPSPSSSWPT